MLFSLLLGHLKVEEKMQQRLTETGNDSAEQKTEKPNIQVQQLRRSAFKILEQSQDSLLLSAPNSMTVAVKHYTLHTMHHKNMMNVDVLSAASTTNWILMNQRLNAS